MNEVGEQPNLFKNIYKNYQTNYKYKILINILIIIFLIILIRIFKGPFVITVNHNSLDYDISISNNKIDKFQVTEEYNKAIIPFLLYNSETTSHSYDLHTNTYFAKETKYELGFKIYKCYKDKKETSCLNNFSTKKEINYSKKNFYLTIKYKDSNKILYKGELINDITKYISETGDYNIIIEGNIDNINTKVELFVNIFN